VHALRWLVLALMRRALTGRAAINPNDRTVLAF